MKAIRLDKYLADMGKGTRSQIKADIRRGMVLVNGTVEKSAERKITEHDKVSYGQESVSYEKYRYFLMNKPSGVISAVTDQNQRTVLDLLKPEDRIAGMFPVGRLDKDTEGLLLLTNDGQLAHELLSPKRHVSKTYYARLQGIPSKEHLAEIQDGIALKDGTRCKPAQCVIEHADDEAGICEASVTVVEGKYHQIKRMMAACGAHVTYLKRTSMGPLELDGSLAAGAYRELTEEERGMLLGQERDGKWGKRV